MTHDPMLLRRVLATLQRHRYRFSTELGLHDGIAQVLTTEGIQHEREHVAGPQDRFDFLLPGGIVIEVKTKDSLTKALRQIDRYAARDDVSAVILATSRAWGGSAARPGSLHGKPAHFLILRSAAF